MKMKRTRSRCVLAAMVLSLLFSSVGFAFADSNVPTLRDNRHYKVYHDKSMYKTASYSFSGAELLIIGAGGSAAGAMIKEKSPSLSTAAIGALGYVIGSRSLKGLRYHDVYTTERNYYSKDRLTGRESYLYTEWVGTTTWTYKMVNGSWQTLFSNDVSFRLK